VAGIKDPRVDAGFDGVAGTAQECCSRICGVNEPLGRDGVGAATQGDAGVLAASGLVSPP
jgi:hypothetical protein